jgi:predicted Zn-dependent protease
MLSVIRCLSVLFVCALLSCATNPVTGEHQLMLVSDDDEIKIGRQTDAEIDQTYGVYNDRVLNIYVDHIGQRMAKLSHRPNLPYTFKVLDTPVVNAFAVPGGYVYMTRGIMAYLNSEAELAGVLGHEIGHITARHTAEQLTKAQLAQIGLGVGAIVSEEFRQFAGVAQFGVGMLFLKFSRDNERQADDLGAEYSTRAGYDASQMAEFFLTLEKLHPSSDRSGLQGWFTTHPNPPDRINAVRAKAREWAKKSGIEDLKVNRQAYFKKIDGLVFGEDPRHGYLDDGMFYHPHLRFQFPVPVNWKVNNTPAQVQMFSPGQDAVILFSLTQGDSADDAARRFVAESRAGIIRAESVKINGLPAKEVISDVKTGRGTLRVMSYFIAKGQYVYVFHGFTSPSRFAQYQSTFKSSMGQFRTLTDQRKIDVEPARIRIVTTKRAGTVNDALKSLGVPSSKRKEAALLNGKELSDQIEANTSLKIVTRGS